MARSSRVRLVLSGNNQVITFTPSAPLTAGSLVQVFLSPAVTDTFGNALNNFAYSFTVAPNVSAVAPTIVTTVPYNGAGNGGYGNYTGVPTNAPIDIEFSKPIDPTTVNSTNFALAFCGFNGQAVSTTVTLRTATIVRITPTSVLFPNFTNPGYCYTVSTAVKDTNGLALVNAFPTTSTRVRVRIPRNPRSLPLRLQMRPQTSVPTRRFRFASTSRSTLPRYPPAPCRSLRWWMALRRR